MAKIAALVLPARRRPELDRFCDKMGDLLRHSSVQEVEKCTYVGTDAVCGLLRMKPDALNPRPQPIQSDETAGVACGYYLSNDAQHTNISGQALTQLEGGSVTRLIWDVATSGIRQLPNNDGVYAFACWQGNESRLIAGVDKLGMQPLYWTAIEGGGYAVASEAKALVPFINEPFVNWSAWEEYFTFGFLFGNHTQFEGIYRLGAAEVIECRVHRHSISRTENFLENIEIVDRSTEDFLEEQHVIFDQALGRLSCLFDIEHDTMLTLSGGFDSRRIFGGLLRRNLQFNTYTVPVIKPDGTEYESHIASDLCKQYGVTNYRVYPDSLAGREQVAEVRDLATDFESDEHRYATFFAMGLGCNDKVNFDGLGGDHLVGALRLEKEYFETGGQQRFIDDWPVHALDQWLRLPVGTPPLEIRAKNELNQWGNNPNKFTYFYLMSRVRREVGLAPFMIQANGMGTLCPYLDRQFMRSALSFPPWKKVDSELQRALISKYDPALLRVATTHDKGVGSDPRYLNMTDGIERQARLRNLQAMTRRLSRLSKVKPWGPDLVQRWRFRGASHFHKLLPEDQVQWEIAKAEKTGAFLHFMDTIASKERYLTEALKLQNIFDFRPGWVRQVER